MFGFFRRASGWRKVKVGKGCVVEMPARPELKRQTLETPHGRLLLTIYNAKTDGKLSCQVTVREGTAVETRSDTELFEGWKEEFNRAMAFAGIPVQPAGEGPLPGGGTGRDLTYYTYERTVLTRVQLIRDGGRFIALSAIGPLARVQSDGERFLASFAGANF